MKKVILFTLVTITIQSCAMSVLRSAWSKSQSAAISAYQYAKKQTIKAIQPARVISTQGIPRLSATKTIALKTVSAGATAGVGAAIILNCKPDNEYMKYHKDRKLFLEAETYVLRKEVDIANRSDKHDDKPILVQQVFVKQESGQIITAPKDMATEKKLYTDGLRCCIATIVFIQDIKGNRKAIMTHYSPLKATDNIERLDSLIDIAKNDLDSIEKTYAIIVVPGNFKKGFFSNEETLVSVASQQWINDIKKTIARKFPNPFYYTHIYHTNSFDGASVEFGIDPDMQPSYYYHIKNSCYFPQEKL